MYEIVAEAKRHGFPSIELQTNGMLLAAKPEMLRDLDAIGLTGIAVSIAHPDPVQNQKTIGVDHDYLTLMDKASEMGFLCRVTLNLVRNAFATTRLSTWADTLVASGVHQLTLRQLGQPTFNGCDTDAADRVRTWIDANAMPQDEVDRLAREVAVAGVLIRQNSFGVDIYDYHGLSTAVATSDDTCMSRNTDPNEIRSMILSADGHIRSSWDLPGSILI